MIWYEMRQDISNWVGYVNMIELTLTMNESPTATIGTTTHGSTH